MANFLLDDIIFKMFFDRKYELTILNFVWAQCSHLSKNILRIQGKTWNDATVTLQPLVENV